MLWDPKYALGSQNVLDKVVDIVDTVDIIESTSCLSNILLKKYPKHSVSRKSHLIYTNVRNHFQTNQNLGAFSGVSGNDF